MHLGGVNKLSYWSPLRKDSCTCYYWFSFFFFGATFFLILSSTAISDYKQSLQFQSLNEEKRNIHLQACFYDFLWSPLSLSLFCYFSFWIFIWRYASIGYSKWQKNWGLYIWHSSWWCCASQHRWSAVPAQGLGLRLHLP